MDLTDDHSVSAITRKKKWLLNDEQQWFSPIWLNLLNAELSLTRCWRRPKYQETKEEGDYT